MSVFGTLFSRKQTCPNCNQKSNPIARQGNWEVSGRMGNATVIKCTKCGAGLIMGMVSDRYITPYEMEKMERERDVSINRF